MPDKSKACVLPLRARYVLWAQSPNGTWMLISGSWQACHAAIAFAEQAGYELTDARNAQDVLDEIERQHERRFNVRVTLASDVPTN